MNEGWWVLLTFMYLYGGLEGRLQEIVEETATREAFEDYAKDCPHLELDDDGRATHHICHHPVRDDPTDWVMCDRRVCPFMMVNYQAGNYEKPFNYCQNCGYKVVSE